MRLVIRLIVVIFFASAVSSNAFADNYVGGIDNTPDQYWQNSGVSGSGSAAVTLDVGTSTLSSVFTYPQLVGSLGDVSSIKLSLVKNGALQWITKPIAVVNDSSTLSAQLSPVSLAGYWDPGFIQQMSSAQATDALKMSLDQGVVYLSINTTNANNVLHGLLSIAEASFTSGKGSSTAKLQLHAFTVGTQPFVCGKDLDLPRCVIPVYVWIKSNACFTFVPFSEVTVTKGTHPRILWFLVNSHPTDQADYRFTANKGIVLKDRGTGYGSNNPITDFGPPNDDNREVRRFRWNSIHSRGSSFDYAVVAERLDPDSGSPKTCLPADPTVTNE